jgi:hypothetical protein
MTLQEIEKAIMDYYQVNKKLPTKLGVYDEVDIYILTLEFWGLTG